MKYQPHIDGLRAVAVMAVILFHFGVPGLQGGYIGVDVFFVISGYLITKLILEEVQGTGSFRFWHFYARRIRRLIPALLATCLVTTIIAAMLFSPEMFEEFGTTLMGAVLSFSNIVFWWQSGYWDEASYLKPLLHTWSLGVEEQFYYVWPALLVLGPVLGLKRAVLPLLVGLGFASFLANLFWIDFKFDADYASTTFFWMPFRIYEFVLGALGVLAAERWQRTPLAQEAGMAAGLVMIGLSACLFTDKLVFPSYYALLPCTGALLVIMSGEARWAGAIVRNRVAVWIGLISYSLYLVHWPVFVFYRYKYLEDPSGGTVVALLLVTFVLAYLLHEWVERPFYQRGDSRQPQARRGFIVPGSACAMLVLAALGLQISTSDGWAWRYPGALTADQVAEGKERRYQIRDIACSIDNLEAAACKMDRPLQVLFIGNSHETDALNAFYTAYEKNDDINFIRFGALNDCELKIKDGTPTSDVAARECDQRVAKLISKNFVSKIDVVVYGAFSPFGKGKGPTFRLLKHLKNRNSYIKFVVVGGYFVSREHCSELMLRFGTAELCKSDASFFDGYANEPYRKKQLIDYLYIDKAKLLCPAGTLESCETEAYGEPMFYDNHHLSFGFSRHVGERMAEVYEEELAALGFKRNR